MKRGIEASTSLPVPFELAGRVLADDPAAVVADEPADRPAPPDEGGHLRTSLGVELAATAFRQAVDVELGPLHLTDGEASLPLRWRASGRDRLFPVFEGRLGATPDGAGTLLSVAGVYTVPLGPVGRFGDGLIGRRLARQSLTDFLEGAARRLDAAVHDRTASVSWRPSAYPVALREAAATDD